MAPTNKNKRLRDNDQDSDTDSDNERSTTPVKTGQGFWSRSRQVTTSHWVNCRPLLSRRVSRRWPEPSKALKGWGMDLSWWSALGNRRRWVFSRPPDLLIDQYVSPPTKRWTRHVASSAAVSCQAWRRWKSGRNYRNRVSWGPQGDGEEGYWKGPHQHPVSDLQHSRPPERDHGRLSKGEGGLVCSQPYALLQLQQVWLHEPTLQGCCEVYGLWKRWAWRSEWGTQAAL